VAGGTGFSNKFVGAQPRRYIFAHLPNDLRVFEGKKPGICFRGKAGNGWQWLAMMVDGVVGRASPRAELGRAALLRSRLLVSAFFPLHFFWFDLGLNPQISRMFFDRMTE